MVNTQQSQRFEPTTSNFRMSDTQEEETQHTHVETLETPPIKPIPRGKPGGWNSHGLNRASHGNMVTYIQGVQLTDRVTPRAPDAIDKFQRLNAPIF